MRLVIVKRRILAAICLSAVAVASPGLIGCDSSRDSRAASITSLGKPFNENVPAVSSASLSEKNVGQAVAIEGKIVQQCPALGCWFRIKDEDGETFINLASAKLRLTQDRVGQQVQVQGHLVKIGGQLRVEAQYVEFASVETDMGVNQE